MRDRKKESPGFRVTGAGGRVEGFSKADSTPKTLPTQAVSSQLWKLHREGTATILAQSCLGRLMLSPKNAVPVVAELLELLKAEAEGRVSA